MTPLNEWGTFCEVLGSAAAALTGLQFVTIALLADMPIRDPGEADAGDAFATPTIVHFVTSLFLAAALSAPWHSITPAATLWGLAGGAGIIYTLIVIRRVRTQSSYAPVFEDWLFHAALPLLAYVTLAASAPFAPHRTAPPPFSSRLPSQRCCSSSSAYTTHGTT